MIILANVVIPTVAEHVPIMLVLLLPVVIIESIVLAKRHLLPYSESFRLTLRANLRSTFVGIPLGYVFAWIGIIPAGLFAALLPERLDIIEVVLMNAVGHGEGKGVTSKQ